MAATLRSVPSKSLASSSWTVKSCKPAGKPRTLAESGANPAPKIEAAAKPPALARRNSRLESSEKGFMVCSFLPPFRIVRKTLYTCGAGIEAAFVGREVTNVRLLSAEDGADGIFVCGFAKRQGNGVGRSFQSSSGEKFTRDEAGSETDYLRDGRP